MALAASVERASDHPLANAVIRYAADLPSYEAESVQNIKGCGMDPSICGRRVLIGNQRLMEQNGIELTGQVLNDLEDVQNSGYPLTLYTCTTGAKSRVVVFCSAV